MFFQTFEMPPLAAECKEKRGNSLAKNLRAITRIAKAAIL
jgi:hypothetical protein